MDKSEVNFQTLDRKYEPQIDIKKEPEEYDDSIYECPVCKDYFSSHHHFTDHLSHGLKCSTKTKSEKLIRKDDASPSCKCEQPIVNCNVDDKSLITSSPDPAPFESSCQESLKKEEKKSPKNMPYFLCPMCSDQLLSEDNFETHIKKHKADENKSFSCPLCEYKAPFNKYKALQHLKKHSTKKPFECSECPYTTNQKGNLTIHFRIHTGEKPYKCTICPYASAQSEPLKAHMRTHTGEKPFKCPMCPFSASQRPTIKNHIKRSHSGPESKEKKFKCSQCTYSTRHKGDLRKHALIHSGTKPLQCKTCSYSTYSKSNLTAHTHIHVEKSLKCQQCSFITKYEKSLVMHQKRHETEAESKVFKCDACTFSSTCKTSYVSHRRFDCTSRPHKCPDCDRAFYKKRHLTRHSSIHSSDRPLKCTYPDCTYGTYRKDSLRIHQSKHHSTTEAVDSM